MVDQPRNNEKMMELKCSALHFVEMFSSLFFSLSFLLPPWQSTDISLGQKLVPPKHIKTLWDTEFS